MDRNDLIRLAGDKALMEQLNTMKTGSVKRIMAPAINKGLTIVLERAKELAPEDTGALRRSLGKKVSRGKKGASGKVFVRSGYGDDKHKPEKIAHLVEFGHKGPHPAPPHPFLTAAMNEKKGEALKAVQETARENIKKAVEKAAASDRML